MQTASLILKVKNRASSFLQKRIGLSIICTHEKFLE